MGITIEPAALTGLAVWTETGRVFLPLNVADQLPKDLRQDIDRLLRKLFLPEGASVETWGDQSEAD